MTSGQTVRSGTSTIETLQGNIGTTTLVFTVLAYNGPMVVFLGFIPVSILLGSGVGTPIMFVACGLIALLFATGLVAMGLRIPKPGGFYTFISAGLGKVAGLGAGFAAIMCYLAVYISAYGLGGEAASNFVEGTLGGPSLPWWAYAAALFAVVSVLGYLNISFSARILTVFLALEVALLVIYDVSVLVQGGAQGLSWEGFDPRNLTAGSVAIGFLFGVAIFGGFEATVIFRDEVRRPSRTIPRATYAVVGILAGLYAVSAWLFINSYGADAIGEVLSGNLVDASSESVRQYTGEVGYFLASLLLVTSAFALLIAGHNITSRYLFNLSSDGVFPSALSQVHPKHGSPHRASLVVSALCVLGVVPFALSGVAGDVVYARLSGVYSYTFVFLLSLASLAIATYLIRHRDRGLQWVPVLATSVAFAFLGTALVVATRNFDYLAGTAPTMTVVVLCLIYGIILTGAVLAVVYRSRRPDVFARIGREDAAVAPADEAELQHS